MSKRKYIDLEFVPTQEEEVEEEEEEEEQYASTTVVKIENENETNLGVTCRRKIFKWLSAGNEAFSFPTWEFQYGMSCRRTFFRL